MRILIVDDQRSARRVLRKMLSTVGDLEISEAGNADEAFGICERTPPDLLLLDIRLSTDTRERRRARASCAGSARAGRRRRR